MMERITSRTNPLCTHIRKLASSTSYRRSCGEFLCDSPKLLEEVLLWQADLRTVVVTEQYTVPDLPEGVRTVAVPSDVMRSISPAQTPQGALCICGLPKTQALMEQTGTHYMVLDGVQDPGNVGTILRTADAFRADGLLLVNGCADLYNPKTVRASMGAIFRCPVWRVELKELTEFLTHQHLPLYGAALLNDTVDVRHVDYTRAAVAVGSEGRGLSEAVLICCDQTVKIPMHPHCESLNAAVAASVMLWEMTR